MSDSGDSGRHRSHAALDGARAALPIHVGDTLAEARRTLILATLEACGNHKTRAAAMLGISLKTLYNHLNSYRDLRGNR